jgi:hypothetical protein
VKTFLTESELSKSQLARLQKLKHIATNYVSMDKDIIKERLKNDDFIGVHRDYENNMKLVGGDPDAFDKQIWINGLIGYVAIYYGIPIERKSVSLWVKKNSDRYPSIKEMLEGFGWECNDMELSRLVLDAIHDITKTDNPMDGYFYVFQNGNEYVKNLTIEKMNKRRSKYEN